MPWPAFGASLRWARGLRLQDHMAHCAPPLPGVVGSGLRLPVRRVMRGSVSGGLVASPRLPWAPCASSARGSGYLVARLAVTPAGGTPGRPGPTSPGPYVWEAGGAWQGGFAPALRPGCPPSSVWLWPSGAGPAPRAIAVRVTGSHLSSRWQWQWLPPCPPAEVVGSGWRLLCRQASRGSGPGDLLLILCFPGRPCVSPACR